VARFDYNPLTNQLDLVDSPAGYINGVVADPTLLPVTLGTPALDSVYLAKAGSGLWLISRKPAGLYCRVANNGNAADWQFLGAFPEVNADGNWALYSSADPTKELKFQLSGITTGTTRTLTVPDASGTLPLLETANTFTQNQTLDGTNNVAPNQTAASGSSVMTRDLARNEFAIVRDRIQKTFWFATDGQADWVTLGTSANTVYAGSGSGGFFGGRYIWTTSLIGSNALGAGLGLGNDNQSGGSNYRFSDGGLLTLSGRFRKSGTSVRQGVAFVMGVRSANSMWHPDAYGLYYVPQPTLSWGATTAFTQHQRIDVAGVVFSVSTAGTTAGAAPVWTDALNSTVTDGTVTWRNCGPHTSNKWALCVSNANASSIVIVDTGKNGPPDNNRGEWVLKLQMVGSGSAPYTIRAWVETGTANGNTAGESVMVTTTTSSNTVRQPQFWTRADEQTAAGADTLIRTMTIDGELGSLQ
jgi:hypothetical protein